MASDLSWEHQYCLSCDRQTDGQAYCSESCRLADFEKSSTGTPSTSPGFADANFGWARTKSSTSSKFYLSPAYDFSNAQPYGSTPRPHRSHTQGSHLPTAMADGRSLTPSSSHSSLCSLQSTSSTGSDGQQLSERSRKQLRDYASSFEHARLQRRRSY